MQNPIVPNIRTKRPVHLQTHTAQQRQKGETILGPEPQEQNLLEQHLRATMSREAQRKGNSVLAGVMTPTQMKLHVPKLNCPFFSLQKRTDTIGQTGHVSLTWNGFLSSINQHRSVFLPAQMISNSLCRRAQPQPRLPGSTAKEAGAISASPVCPRAAGYKRHCCSPQKFCLPRWCVHKPRRKCQMKSQLHQRMA